MGYVVCHIQKPKGNDAGTSAHIERRVHPSNADQSREYLNQKLVEYLDGVENRTQAITHRIETAGITRKIGTNQVRALRVMLSGTPEDMHRIVAEGRLDEWCADNLDWLRKTFGADNVVAADLHRDEQTPHIHATVVPIVTGERRKAAIKPTTPGKRTYRKKPANAVRLCADDVMTRDNLERFQDTYAEAMAKYGLQRGVRGSDARHIATTQYYRDLHVRNEDLKQDIAVLEERKQDYAPYSAQEDLNLLMDVLPNTGENLRMARFCKDVGLTTGDTRTLFHTGAVTVSGKLHSTEHDRDFEARDAKLQLTNYSDDPNALENTYRLRLSLNGQNILDWFREQFERLRQVVRPYVRQTVALKNNNSKGYKR